MQESQVLLLGVVIYLELIQYTVYFMTLGHQMETFKDKKDDLGREMQLWDELKWASYPILGFLVVYI